MPERPPLFDEAGYRAYRDKLRELTESTAEWKDVTLDVNFPPEASE